MYRFLRHSTDPKTGLLQKQGGRSFKRKATNWISIQSRTLPALPPLLSSSLWAIVMPIRRPLHILPPNASLHPSPPLPPPPCEDFPGGWRDLSPSWRRTRPPAPRDRLRSPPPRPGPTLTPGPTQTKDAPRGSGEGSQPLSRYAGSSVPSPEWRLQST